MSSNIKDKGPKIGSISKENVGEIADAVIKSNIKALEKLKSGQSDVAKADPQKKKAFVNSFDYTITGPEFEWLLSVIKFKTDLILKSKVDPLFLSKDGDGRRVTVKDDQVEDICLELNRDIANALSSKYVDYMADKYFGSVEELRRYVIEVTTDRFYTYILKANAENQKKYIEDENRRDVLKANGGK